MLLRRHKSEHFSHFYSSFSAKTEPQRSGDTFTVLSNKFKERSKKVRTDKVRKNSFETSSTD